MDVPGGDSVFRARGAGVFKAPWQKTQAYLPTQPFAIFADKAGGCAVADHAAGPVRKAAAALAVAHERARAPSACRRMFALVAIGH